MIYKDIVLAILQQKTAFPYLFFFINALLLCFIYMVPEIFFFFCNSKIQGPEAKICLFYNDKGNTFNKLLQCIQAEC